MSGRIPERFIDELMNRVDIVEVVGARIELKRAGSNYHALCPFHTEKTPSFTVSPSKQFYHCFGCGAHGTAIRFLMEYERLEFRDAVETLARHVGLDIPELAEDDKAKSLAPLYDLISQASRHFQHWLRRHPERARAVDYLQQRGVSGKIAAEYGLGFAPPGWDHLCRALSKPDLMVQAGLAAQRENRTYDRFRDRVMFPIRDRRGRVIGFGGRVIGDGEPKYLNSPETSVFHKGRELYGLYECLQHERHPAQLVVVEGYMDVVALAQFGFHEAVATLGTATSTVQVERLFQASRNVVFCFDGDRAGRQAAWRALENTLPALRDGRQAKFLFLPEGEDPDTIVRNEGVDEFRDRLKAAKPLSDFFFEHLGTDVDLDSVDGRARLAEAVAPLFKRLPSGIYRELMLERLAELTRVDAARVEASLAPRNERPRREQAQRPPKPVVKRTPIRLAIALLLQRPSLASVVQAPSRYRDQDIPGMELFGHMLTLIAEDPAITPGALLERFRDSKHEAVLWQLAAWDHLVPDSGVETEFRDSIVALDRLIDRKRLQYLNDRLQQGLLTREELREWQELKGVNRTPTE